MEEQRLAEANKIRLEQLMKWAQQDAQKLHQRAAGIECETAEELARLLHEDMEVDEEEGGGGPFQLEGAAELVLYTTEVYSTEDGHQPY